MQNMILQKCAWASIQTTVAYTNHTHTHTHTHICVCIYTFWAFSNGEERQSGWRLLCVNKEEKIKKNDISLK